MQKQKFDEIVSYFNKKVSEMEIETKYKMELLGMITALGHAHEKETHEERTETHGVYLDMIDRSAAQTELMMKCERYTLAKESHGMGHVEWSSDLISVEDAMNAIRWLPSAQPEQSSEIQGILDYLDTVLHPIVSPEHWDVYSELHDMTSRLLSAQFEPNCKGCKHQPRFSHEEPCCTCANNYENKYER